MSQSALNSYSSINTAVIQMNATNITEKKRQITYWLKNRDHAFRSGQFKEVNRINKILSFYGYGNKTNPVAA